MLQFSSVQLLSLVRLFVTPWIAACQASLSITNSQRLLKLMPINSVMPSNHLILCCPLLLLPPIPPSVKCLESQYSNLYSILIPRRENPIDQWVNCLPQLWFWHWRCVWGLYNINLAAKGPPLVEERIWRKGPWFGRQLKRYLPLGFFNLLIYWTVLSLRCFCAGFLELWRAGATLRLVCGLLIVVASLVVGHRL